MSDIQNTEAALVPIPSGQNAMEVFTGDFDVTLDPILKRVRAQIDDYLRIDRDPSNPKDREATKSFAYKIARSKTALDAAGKAVVDDLKALPKKIDANRFKTREMLDAWRDEVLGPVTKWELEEKARVDRHVAAIERITAIGDSVSPNLTVTGIETLIAQVTDFLWGNEDREEFADEYDRARDNTLRKLADALVARKQYDSDQAELAALRAAKAEQEAREAQERAERDRLAREQENAARREREAREKALREEAETKLAAERAERARLQAEADQRAEADRKAAREREEAERREKNVAHKRKVNAAAVEAIIIKLSVLEDDTLDALARAVVTAIAKGEIPNVTIQY